MTKEKDRAFKFVMNAKSMGWTDEETIKELMRMGVSQEHILWSLKRVGHLDDDDYKNDDFRRRQGPIVTIMALLLAVSVLVISYMVASLLIEHFRSKDVFDMIDELAWKRDMEEADIAPIIKTATLTDEGNLRLSFRNNLRYPVDILVEKSRVYDMGEDSCHWYAGEPHFVEVGGNFTLNAGGCPKGDRGEELNLFIMITYRFGEGYFERERTSQSQVSVEVSDGSVFDE